ncbi:Target of EGR1, member 1 (Nuclear) [Mortierella sp. AM989]|nr:Target of EGR1, member 1 (Nuclear) [Mortierella sp. AM989]
MSPVPLPLPTYNQVTKHNLAQLQPMIVLLLKQAAFIALDAEFTGLGSKAVITRASDIQERYQHLCDLARSHALVAFGLSIFIKTAPVKANVEGVADAASTASTADTQSDLERNFQVHNFNFSMLSETDYAVSPKSMIFLAESGLDLNQWILEGIPYTGGDRLTNEGGRGNPNGIMRSIFKRIMTRQVPVVIHNGFLDMIFLYYSFYANLPPKLSTFVADLSDMFTGGLFDTKYISDYITRERSSFLAYLFRKYERYNDRAKEETATQIYSTFGIQPRLALPPVQEAQPKTKPDNSNVAYCKDYAFHGVCKKNMRCGKSHDLDMILDAEEEQRDSKKRKRQKNSHVVEEVRRASSGNDTFIASTAEVNGETTSLPETTGETSNSPKARSEAIPTMVTPAATTKSVENLVQLGEKFHSAYFDAFMTGTIFSHQVNQHKAEEVETKAKNKIYLIGKSFPLIVEKSAFAKYSPEHERQRAGQ